MPRLFEQQTVFDFTVDCCTYLACASSNDWSVMLMICCKISPISCLRPSNSSVCFISAPCWPCIIDTEFTGIGAEVCINLSFPSIEPLSSSSFGKQSKMSSHGTRIWSIKTRPLAAFCTLKSKVLLRNRFPQLNGVVMLMSFGIAVTFFVKECYARLAVVFSSCHSTCVWSNDVSIFSAWVQLDWQLAFLISISNFQRTSNKTEPKSCLI